MDYGSHLTKTVPNPNRKSKQYAKQPKFEGSNRQLRGAVLRFLLEHTLSDIAQMHQSLGRAETEIVQALEGLEKDHMIIRQSGTYRLAKRTAK